MRVFQLVCLCILAWSVWSFSKYPAESVQYGKTVKKERKEYLSNGGYRLHTEYADGSVKILTATPCHWCEGKGYCKECGGAGENIVTSYGKEISKPCPLCHGVRLCPYCEGKLYLFETVWKQPAEYENLLP